MHQFSNPPSDNDDEGGRDGQNAWSSAFPHDHSQPFDSHPFGRMDRPATPPLFDNQPVGMRETHTSPSRAHESFAAQSISGDMSFSLAHSILAPPWNDAVSRGQATSHMPHDRKSEHETDDFNTPSKSQGLHRDVLPGEITPYVGLRARLTQVPINRWTILLILVLARLIILFESLNASLASAQDEAASACSKVEEIGSAMASMPYYLSVGVNELVAMGITDTVRGLVKVLMMILNGMLEVLMFQIERTYGTIVCVATSFIKGLIGLAAAAVEDLLQAINAGLTLLVGDLADAIATLADGLTAVIDGLDKLPWVAIKVPSLDNVEAAVDGLKNADFINATATFTTITDFNDKIPDFTEIISDVKSVISIPFNKVETLLNESFGNWSMDPSMFPTASKDTLTFCTGNDTITEMFNVLFIITKSAKVIAIAGLLLCALLAGVFMAWWEVQRYRRTVVKSRVFLNREPMDTVYVSGRPLTAGAGLWISHKVSSDPNRQMLIRWVVSYATTYTALFVLSLAVAGAFSVLCQFFILRAVQKETPGLASEVGSFVTNAVGVLENSSAKWANESNQAILNLQDDINSKTLVHVQDATGAVVNLINEFENATTALLEKFFGNNPIGVAADNFTENLLDCIIFDSLNKVKSGVEWINQEAHVTLPKFPFDVFSMGATGSGDNSSFSTLLTNSGMQTANDITNALNKVTVMLQSSIVQEGLIALALFLVYMAYVFFAVAQAALRMCCLRERSRTSEDAEKNEYAMTDLRASQRTSIHDEGRLPRTTCSPPSVAPSYQLSDLDVSQLAHYLSHEQDGPSQIEQRPADHVETQEVQEEDKDPFADDTYAIGDEEVDDIVGVLRESAEIVGNMGARTRQAWAEGADE